MIGNPHQARDWDHFLRTDRGERIVSLLMPFHEVPLALAPPLPDLDARIRGLSIDGTPGEAAPVSVGAHRAAVASMPECMRRGVLSGFEAGVIEGTCRPVSELLERRFEAEPWPDKVYDLVHQSLVRTLADHLDRDYRGYSTTALRLTLAHTLTYHVHFIAAGKDALAATVAPLTDMFRRGNFPVAKLRDGRFLVLTS